MTHKPLLEQWLESKGIEEPTLEDILTAADEMEAFYQDEEDGH